jgi:hypothetical protein
MRFVGNRGAKVRRGKYEGAREDIDRLNDGPAAWTDDLKQFARTERNLWQCIWMLPFTLPITHRPNGKHVVTSSGSTLFARRRISSLSPSVTGEFCKPRLSVRIETNSVLR